MTILLLDISSENHNISLIFFKGVILGALWWRYKWYNRCTIKHNISLCVP